MVSRIRERLGRGYRWWDWRWEEHSRFTRGDYFIFVEEGSPVRSEGLIGPAEGPIAVEEMGRRPWRFRTSGISTRSFLRAESHVDPLDPTQITLVERRARRAQLLEAFGRARLPLIDIIVGEEDDELPFLRAALVPGSWHWIGVRKRKANDDRLPVYMGTPEDGPGPFSPGALQLLEAVPLFFEYRLRDIFSLAHIPDAGEEEEFGGGGAPPPDKPRAGDEFAIRLLGDTDLHNDRPMFLDGEA